MIIHSYKISNFYSIKNNIELKFTVDKKAPKTDAYIKAYDGRRISKIGFVIGANASGKTNVLKVLPFFCFLALNSAHLQSQSLIPIRQFAFTKKSIPTNIEVIFEISEDSEISGIFNYTIRLTEKQILNESLTWQSKQKEKITRKILFLRRWDIKQQKYKLRVNRIFGNANQIKNAMRKNASILSVAVLLNNDFALNIATELFKIQTNVVEAGWLGDNIFSSNATKLVNIFDFYYKRKGLKKRAEKLLRKFDIALDEIDIVKEISGNRSNFKVRAKHNINEYTYELPFNYESSGTKQLFILLTYILMVLEKGGVAILDELDVNIHPDIVAVLIDMFVDPDTNPNNAQLLFSAHVHSAMNVLDKYQIFLTERNKNGETDLWRLDEMKGVRLDDNYYAKYVAGSYGAIPNII